MAIFSALQLMIWSLFFACFVILIVVLKYVRFGSKRCPQCRALQDSEQLLCPQCGWIYDPPEDDSDYGELEEEETRF